MLRSLARALGALLCLFALAPSSVSAHAVLVEARPGDGERLDQPPAEIELRFNEPVVPVAVRLLDASGAEMPDVAVEPRGETLVVRPPSPLPEGTYLLSYRVTSVDGHPAGATLRFGVGVEPIPEQVAAAGDRTARWAGVLSRWLFYVAALGAAGLALFVEVVRPPEVVVRSRAGRFLRWLAVGGIVAILFRLGAAGLELTGPGPAALVTAAPWAAAAGTTLGRAAIVAAVGLALLFLSDRRGGGWLRWSGAVAVAASFALTGHAASAQPRWLAAPALAVHALSGAFWLGSLLPLLWCVRDLAPDEASAALRRFSAAATVTVGSLVLAGAWLAWLQLGGRLAPLWETAYGLRLAGKLLLVAGLLALAAANRFVLAPRLARAGARRWLGRALLADVALGLAVLAVTASFPLDPPPRATPAATREGAGAEGITVFVAARDGQAALTLTPGRPGPNRLEAWVTDASGAPVSAQQATVSVARPDAGIEPVRGPAAMSLPGVYVADGLPVPLAGRWRLRLDLLVDDFTRLTFEGTLAVGGEHDGDGTDHGHRPGDAR